MTTPEAIALTRARLSSGAGQVAWARGSLRGEPGPALLAEAVWEATGLDRYEDVSAIMEGVLNYRAPNPLAGCRVTLEPPAPCDRVEAAMARLL